MVLSFLLEFGLVLAQDNPFFFALHPHEDAHRAVAAVRLDR
jgi:hypothetical protein